ncbi:hypothetical protein Tco_0954914 [Tanacetum coccineum]|uniref:Uncharacterized protein n=1 Tax=Tanacetum coccineum TaxID=301880 RepID=A0ABQ5E5S2_9ASTR
MRNLGRSKYKQLGKQNAEVSKKRTREGGNGYASGLLAIEDELPPNKIFCTNRSSVLVKNPFEMHMARLNTTNSRTTKPTRVTLRISKARTREYYLKAAPLCTPRTNMDCGRTLTSADTITRGPLPDKRPTPATNKVALNRMMEEDQPRGRRGRRGGYARRQPHPGADVNEEEPQPNRRTIEILRSHLREDESEN